jgi:carbon monoxide dehydrogenase subunit G
VIAFETSIRIQRGPPEVFDLVSDPVRFSDWNSAVRSVRLMSGQRGGTGSTYAMRRELPSGRAENQLEVTASERPSEFAVRTTRGPTPFAYTYRFAADAEATVLTLEAKVELGGVAGALGGLAAPMVKRGVDANLTQLKRSLEQRPH